MSVGCTITTSAALPEQCPSLREANVVEIRPRVSPKVRNPQTEACSNCTSTSIDAYFSRATDATATSLGTDGVLAMDRIDDLDERGAISVQIPDFLRIDDTGRSRSPRSKSRRFTGSPPTLAPAQLFRAPP